MTLPVDVLPHEIPPVGGFAERVARFAAQVPVLETPRTRMRALGLNDLPAWREILCADRSRYMGGPFSRDDAFREFLWSVADWPLHGHGCWTVEAKNGEILGFAGINFEPSNHEPELGYFFRERHEGQGFAREAAAAARDWGWANGLPSMVSYVDPANPRSGAVAAALGARRDPAAEARYHGTEDEGVEVWRHYPKGAQA